jgi:hypothetical protein
MAAVVAFFEDPLGSQLQLQGAQDGRVAPGAASAQEAELLAAEWLTGQRSHPGASPAADLFPHLPQVGCWRLALALGQALGGCFSHGHLQLRYL